jgi:hypothetical protein
MNGAQRVPVLGRPADLNCLENLATHGKVATRGRRHEGGNTTPIPFGEFFGDKNNDEFFLRTQLKNGWTISGAEVFQWSRSVEPMFRSKGPEPIRT